MSDVMIEAKSLAKNYGKVQALRTASFELRRGEILGFLGPNGAGKSTTMKILTCFIAPSAGSAKVNGFDIWEDPIPVRRSIGYLPESNPLYEEMLVIDFLEWAAAMRGLRGETAQRRIDRVIEEVGIGDMLGRGIGELSKGYRQRVGLAQALVHEPPILILDEPMSGLDPNQATEIRELIRDIGRERTVILSTHNLNEVEITCQRALIIASGRIVADGTPAELAKGETTRYRVVLHKTERVDGKKGSVKDLQAAFRALRGVDRLEVGRDDGRELELLITSASDVDLRADLCRAAFEAGAVILHLEALSRDLEAVFRELTTAVEEDAPPARSRSARRRDDDEDDEDDDDLEDDEGDDDSESDDADDSDADDSDADDSDADDSDEDDEDESDEDESEDDDEKEKG